jgi:hypothetical protein
MWKRFADEGLLTQNLSKAGLTTVLDLIMKTVSDDPLKVGMVAAAKTVFNKHQAKPLHPFDLALSPYESTYKEMCHME